jgi:hypothetical protein
MVVLFIPAALHLGTHGLIAWAFGLLGIYCAYKGVLLLSKRQKLFIVIDHEGIDCPTYNRQTREFGRLYMPRLEITSIAKHESLAGRLIQISRTDGKSFFIQGRLYCELERFLSLCQENGLPIAGR